MKIKSLPIILAAILSAAIGTLAQSAESIKIGLIEPLSGPIAAVGTDALNRIRFAAEQVNKRGGVLGGRNIEIVAPDPALLDLSQS